MVAKTTSSSGFDSTFKFFASAFSENRFVDVYLQALGHFCLEPYHYKLCSQRKIAKSKNHFTTEKHVARKRAKSNNMVMNRQKRQNCAHGFPVSDLVNFAYQRPICNNLSLPQLRAPVILK